LELINVSDCNKLTSILSSYFVKGGNGIKSHK
jgi:hypothetical protein